MPQMKQSSFPQYAVLVDGNYPAKLLKIEEYEKTYDGVATPKLRWIFGVKADKSAIDPDIEYEAEREGELFEVAAYTSYATSESSGFYKIGFPNITPEDWDGDTDELLGLECTVRITSYEKDGSFNNVIDKITKPKKSRKKAPEPVETEEDSSDFEDLPF